MAMVLLSLHVLTTHAATDMEIGTVRIATGDYPPYYAASLPDGGPVAANIMIACKEANLDCKTDFLPWNRVVSMLEAGETDMTFAWSNTEQRRVKYVFSAEPVVFGPTVVFFSKRKFPNGIHFAEFKDLVGYTMLGDESSWYAADFKKFGVKTVWMSANANQWRMLELGRGEALIADAYQGLYTLRQQKRVSDEFMKHIGFTKQSTFKESEFNGYFMFSKSHFDKRKQRIRDSIDKAVKKLGIAATVSKILDEQYSRDAHQVQ